MGPIGEKANLALTYAFSVQIFMIALGVGTGIGINSLLSKAIGEKDKKKIGLTLGNGIFISVMIYLMFFLLGLFASKAFISFQTDDPEIINLGYEYLLIVTTLSFGAIGFSIFKRFLQANGKTVHSTIAQIIGAIVNIAFDYIFIYPLNMSVSKAALATILGQTISLLTAVFFHYFLKREIKHTLKDIIPNLRIILDIFKVGWFAILMQAMLSINMFVMIKVVSLSPQGKVINGTYGVYYKIQQIALFSCFGLSNTIITLLSFSRGIQD